MFLVLVILCLICTSECVYAESLQSRPALCDPMDCSLLGSSVHGDSPGNSGVGCHVLLQEIFLTRRLNPHLLCLLHWQSGSLPVATPGKPSMCETLPKLHCFCQMICSSQHFEIDTVITSILEMEILSH